MATSLLVAAPTFAAERAALVIGNGNYKSTGRLPNPPADAKLIAEAFRNAGFEVTEKTDLGLDEMRAAIETFQAAAGESGSKVVALYYAGHGMEVKGQNYLIPVDAEIKEEYQVASRTLPLQEIMGALDNTKAPLKVVILDCCRDNPLGRSFRRSAAGTGLAMISDTPEGTVLAYATAPGKTALDGAGSNSPFATALDKALRQPGFTVEDVFKFTIGEVKKATNKDQQPWLSLNYEGRFVFLPGTGNPATPGTVPPPMVSPLPATPASLDPVNGFTNSLGMKFMPVAGTKVWFCTTETRVKDYAAFAAENDDIDMEWKDFSYEQHRQTPGHPVVNMNYDDAVAFCQWLSKKEGKRYRLPTDHEWSCAVGLGNKEDPTALPTEKNGVIKEYPWGNVWPPPPASGNFSGQESAYQIQIYEYRDQHPFTAPAANYKANQFGLYDMEGNAQEWCDDWYDDLKRQRVMRGGSWNEDYDDALLSSSRKAEKPQFRDSFYGFRCVLEP